VSRGARLKPDEPLALLADLRLDGDRALGNVALIGSKAAG
jgi:hypothetical protein